MDTPFDPTLADDIKQLLTEVPPQIRAFFASGKVEIVAKNLIQKNQLHVDQGAIVGRELILLLLGINTPLEFTKALVEEAKLDQKIIDSIMQDINDQIFVPLQEEMKKTIGNASQPTKPVMPSAPSRPTFAEGYGEVKEGFRLFGQPTPANPMLPHRPQPVNATTPKYFHLENKTPVQPAQPRPVQPIAPIAPKQIAAPIMDEKLLEDHEEPSPLSPLPARTAPPLPNLPGVIQPSAIPEVKKTVTAVAPVSARPYSTDPYREPIDTP